MDIEDLNLEQLINDVLEQGGRQLSLAAREGYEKVGRGAVRLRFDMSPSENGQKVSVDAKLIGYQEMDEILEMDLGEEVDDLLTGYDPDEEAVAIFTVSAGQTGYFKFTLADPSTDGTVPGG